MSLSLNILFCTETGYVEYYGCGESAWKDKHEGLKDYNWREHFQDEPKMNGCATQTGTDPQTFCFCDSDGCNAFSTNNRSSMNQLSLVLLSFVTMCFAF